MVFYEITAKLQNYTELKEESEDRRAFRASFQIPAIQSFEKSGKRCGIFIHTIRERTHILVCGAVAQNREEIEKRFPGFLDLAGIRAEDVLMQETTMKALCEMLRSAERNGFVEDENYLLAPFDMGSFLRRAPNEIGFEECVLSSAGSDKQLRDTARLLACEETMLPELERIERGAARSGATGHPVHYQISSDDEDIRLGMSKLLLSALLRSGRVYSQRMGIVRCDDDTADNRSYLDRAFRFCEGGAVMIDMSDAALDCEDGDQAQGSMESVLAVCECVKKYRNSVLAVLCLPRNAGKCKGILRENLGTIPLVELQEDTLFGERSRRYLRRLARENGVAAPRSLMKLADDPEKGWLPRDLKAAFDRWFSSYLKEKVYPQYAPFEAAQQEAAGEKPVGSAYSELQSMIGLGKAKDVIGQALDFYKAQKLFRDRGMKQDLPSLHMVFTGDPGTAKTTVARLFARIMKENGVLRYGDLHEVGRGDLVGRYVGWTAKTVQEKFLAARGSVLFIDEAYSLVDDRGGSFGDEAINTIVQEMENCRGDTVVIFAGYPDKMEEFLNRNPGLRSRIAFHVPFENYSEEELLSIAESMADARGLRFSAGVRERLLPVMRDAIRQPDFGNGRFARSLIEKAAMRQAGRLVRGDVINVTDEELRTLLPEDFEEVTGSAKPEPRRVGFAV